jgi:hypothetical protein
MEIASEKDVAVEEEDRYLAYILSGHGKHDRCKHILQYNQQT